MSMDGTIVIGYLVNIVGEKGFRIVGKDCCSKGYTGEKVCKVWDVNINPYRQTCVSCGKELINEGSPICELFDGT
jgi:hypothetical protein